MTKGSCRSVLLGVLFACSFLGVAVAPAVAGTASEVEALPTLDALNRAENPLSNSGKWSALFWDNSSSGHNTGQDLAAGWGPYDGYSTVNGAYWNSSTFSDQSGDAASVTMQTAPGSLNHYVGLWLNMGAPGSAKSGYQLRWILNSGGTYTVKLSKWTSGSEAVLATNASVSIPAGTTMAISDSGATVAAWKGTGGTLTALFSASDSTYSSGYAGIEGSGNASRSTNFKAGSMMATKIANLPVSDPLNRSEETLSYNGRWAALNWAEGTRKPGQDTTEGWSSYDAYPKVNGAYWFQGTLSDSSGWDAASLTMQKASGTLNHYTALWLDMSSPGSTKSGYELRLRTNNDGVTYALILEKWVSGTKTELTWENVNAPAGTTLALVDEGTKVSAWMGTGGTLAKVLSATDSTYGSGYAGIEGSGTIRSTNFRIGTALSSKIANLPVSDQLNRNEATLSNGGKWTALNWAEGTHKPGQDTTEGWTSYDAYPTANGAYWNQGTLSDSLGWDAATATLQKASGTLNHYAALWLNMPSPTTAKSGYELRLRTNNDGVTYALILEKWVSGTKTELEWAYVNTSPGQSISLVDEGSTVSAWQGSVKVLSVADSTYSSGYAGMEGSGTIRSTNFKAGSAATSTDAPDTSIAAGSSAGLVPPNVAFSFTSNETGSTFECSIDGGAYSGCSSPKSYQGLSEGTHTFGVRAVSAAGTDQTPAERSVQVLTAEKTIKGTPLRDNLNRQELPLSSGKWSKLNWTTGIGGAWSSEGSYGYVSNCGGCNVGAYWNPKTFDDATGAVIVGGSVNSAAAYEGERLALWLDMPNPGSVKSGYEARFEASVSNYKYELSKWVSGARTVLGSYSTGSIAQPGSTIFLTKTGGNLTLWSGTAGSYSQVLQANDSTYSSGYAGMEQNGSYPSINNFRAGQIDIQAPDTSISSGPSGKVFPDVTFAFTATEEATFECSMDGGAYATCPTPKEYHGLATGSHTFRVRAVDLSGNQDTTPAERSFTVVEPPQTTITSPQPSFTSNEEPPITFSSSKAGSTFKCSLDGAAYSTCTSPYVMPTNLNKATWHTFLVKATDKEANTDPTPAEWKFNLGIYGPAPATSKLVYPEDGQKTASYYTLKAEWGSAPEGGGVTGVSFQMELPGWDVFKAVPTECVIDGQGKHVSWPLSVASNPGHTEPVFLGVKGCAPFEEAGYPEKEIKFRAAFDGGSKAAGASEPVPTEFVHKYNTSRVGDATETVGPVSVDLITGGFTLSRTDVSIPVPGTEANLEFTRSYDSTIENNLAGYSTVLGGWWQPATPVESEYEGEAWRRLKEEVIPYRPPVFEKECWDEEGETVSCGAGCNPEFCEEWEAEEAQPEERWMELTDNEGGGITFEISGENYVSPDYAAELKLKREDSEHIVLSTSDGTHTIFTKTNGQEYLPKEVSFQATPTAARMIYETTSHSWEKLKLVREIAPSQSGVTCGDFTSIESEGCRTLKFEYEPYNHWVEWGSYGELHVALASIRYYNASGLPATSQKVAEYYYGHEMELTEEWDPRLPKVRETYTYHSPGWNNKITAITPPGEEPWKFDYYFRLNEIGEWEAPLKSVSRASLVEGEPTATTTVAYGVPVSGEGAPYDLSASAVAKWGQLDYPVDATAIFPPTEVPGEEPSDYDQAVVHYMDPDGNQVNTASPAPPGVEGDVITTSEVDARGNLVRSLGARARLEALAAGDPVARSHELDSHSIYSSDGTRELESWGPLHQVRLKNGETVEARTHTKTEYDKGAPELKEGEVAPNLPTREEEGAAIPGQEKDKDVSVSETHYEWKLRLPAETITDPEGLNLITKIAYSSAGQVKEESQPSDTKGEKAGTAKTVFYTAGANSENEACGNKKAWAGLPCLTRPAAEPSPAEANPKMPWTWLTKYTNLDELEESQQKTNGALVHATTMTYDSMGRVKTTQETGEGTALPPVETLYDDESTGRPYSTRFQSELSTSQQLAGLPTVNPFNGTVTPSIVNFETDWSKLGWAVGKGTDLAVGWMTQTSFESGADGAYWQPALSDTGAGSGAIAKVSGASPTTNSYNSLWLDLQSPGGTKEGYELRLTHLSASSDKVELAKWAGGTRTVLTSKESYAFSTGDFALVDRGKVVSAWLDSGSGLKEVLSAEDSSFGSGKAGIEGRGNARVLTNFRAGSFSSLSGAVTTTFDKLGRPIAYEDADGNKSGVGYDLLGRPFIVTDGKGYQQMKYDEDSGMATEMTDSAAGAFKAAYNADGQMIEQLLPNGLAQKAKYDTAGTAVGLEYVKTTNCSTGCTWLEFHRKDSIAGQVLSEEGSFGTHEYSYDQAGRLALAKETPIAGGCTTHAYGFDKDSNRLSKIVRKPKEGGGCDTESKGEEQTYSYDSADRLIGDGTIWNKVEYDNLGRVTGLPAPYSGGGKLITGYFVSNLTHSQTQDGKTNTYDLDPALRERKRVSASGSETGTSIYHYAGGSDAPAWTQEGSAWTRSIGALGGSLGALQKSNGEVTLQIADMHGDTVATAALSPSETKLLGTQRFDEFGKPLQSGPLTGGNAEYGWLGASGRRTQLPSGVIQMGVRSYVPALGRFLSPDPVKGGSANAYDYANQDPVNNFDFTGEAASCTKERGRCKGHAVHSKAERRIEHRTRRIEREHGFKVGVVGGCHGRGSCYHFTPKGLGNALGIVKALHTAIINTSPTARLINEAVRGYIEKIGGVTGNLRTKIWSCADEANSARELAASVMVRHPEAMSWEAGGGYGLMLASCAKGFVEG